MVCLMEPSLSPILVVLGLVYTIFGIVVGSDAQNAVNLSPPPPPSPPFPSPPPPPPPPPPFTPPPSVSQPPPASPLPQGKPLLPASPPPSPPKVLRSPPASSHSFQNKPSDGTSRRRPPASGRPPPKHEHKLNTGKKIGLLFAGVAVILQIGVVGFLIFKRRQLLNINERYETYSS